MSAQRPRDSATERWPLRRIVRRFIAGGDRRGDPRLDRCAVVYLTLRLLELPMTSGACCPKLPLGAFLLLLSGGYFVLFTAAGGQTIGKMVDEDPRRRRHPERSVASCGYPSAPRCCARIACLRLGPAARRGLPPGAVSVPTRRAFHDRVAETRVVPA